MSPSRNQPSGDGVRAAPTLAQPSAARPPRRGSKLYGQRVLFSRDVNPRGYRIRVVVKETDLRSAVGASAFYLSMGQNEPAWAWLGVETLHELIAALQEAALVARGPSTADTTDRQSIPGRHSSES